MPNRASHDCHGHLAARVKWKPIRIRATVAALAFFLCTVIGYAEEGGTHTRSLVGDLFNSTVLITITDGSMPMDGPEGLERRREVHRSILEGDGQQWTLYDRFGGDIRFVGYSGEIRIETGLFDRFYTQIVNDENVFELTMDDLKAFFNQSAAVSNNIVYSGRQPVLSLSDVDGGMMDPRVDAYAALNPVGGEMALGNTGLAVGKWMVGLTSWFLEGELIHSAMGMLQAVMNAGGATVLGALALAAVPLMIMLALFKLCGIVIPAFRGEVSAKEMIQCVIACCLSLGVVYYGSTNPMGVGNVSLKVMYALDEWMHDVLVQKGEPTLSTEDGELGSALWEVAVLEPWCHGMFHRNWDQLYTQAGGQGDALPQSQDDMTQPFERFEVRYDSVSLTGDVTVPLGGEGNIKHWGALAWSVQTPYHVDACEGNLGLSVPTVSARVTPQREDVYVDTLRLFDAMMDISPEYGAENRVRMNYTGSRAYEQWFVSGGLMSVFRSALLLPLLIAGVHRTISAVHVGLAGVTLMWDGLLTLVDPKRLLLLDGLKNLCSQCANFLHWTLVGLALVPTYRAMVGDSVSFILLYILLSYMLISMKPWQMGVTTRSVMSKASTTMQMARSRVLNRLNKRFD